MDRNAVLLEQYKLFVQTADDLTSRRLDANKFYLTILLALFTIAGFLKSKEMAGVFDSYTILVIISIIGLFLSVVWYMNIESYKLLNKAKFQVIHEMEQELAYACFDKEWEFRKGIDTNKAYPRFTQIEKFLPIAMGIVFVVVFFVTIFS